MRRAVTYAGSAREMRKLRKRAAYCKSCRRYTSLGGFPSPECCAGKKNLQKWLNYRDQYVSTGEQVMLDYMLRAVTPDMAGFL